MATWQSFQKNESIAGDFPKAWIDFNESGAKCGRDKTRQAIWPLCLFGRVILSNYATQRYTCSRVK
ncbi:hypothetical protein COLO4_01101 [Corchorus olitorius]|uniref:Uncharacterized protein n=1 Tax=Corchorus olitorius TaxID=93759 RepID=A0A1R3L353_9ROSI|nr:hypothetical protein COLO4_01101 [Corchorus olitorius]